MNLRGLFNRGRASHAVHPIAVQHSTDPDMFCRPTPCTIVLASCKCCGLTTVVLRGHWTLDAVRGVPASEIVDGLLDETRKGGAK